MYTYREICRVAGTNRYSLYRSGYTVGPANHSNIHHAATMPAKYNLIFIESTYDSVNSSPAPWTRAPHIKDLPRAPGCTVLQIIRLGIAALQKCANGNGEKIHALFHHTAKLKIPSTSVGTSAGASSAFK